jgi:hypothetical protein
MLITGGQAFYWGSNENEPVCYPRDLAKVSRWGGIAVSHACYEKLIGWDAL